jgi:hypothetical protein
MTDTDDSPLHLEDILGNPDSLAGTLPHEIDNAITEAKNAG